MILDQLILYSGYVGTCIPYQIKCKCINLSNTVIPTSLVT